MVIKLTLYGDSVAAGFPSPAEDYKEDALSIDEHLITHPAATYLAKASGDSMQGVGIFDQDLLIVDRSLTPRSGHVVVAAVDGELCCKQIDVEGRQLLSANEHYPPIAISADQDLVIEGVVKASIRYHWKG